MPRSIIVNADDFGLSEGVNRGIIECAGRGIVTSASLMVNWGAAPEAAAYAKQNLRISIGLHVDLGEWVLCNGEWEPLYHVVNTDDAEAVARELGRQMAEFRRLLGRNPSHLDSHQHVHRNEPVRSLMLNLARELSVPVRECAAQVHYCGDFYGQGAECESLPDALTVENFTRILDSLPEGITEIGCHPGYGEGLQTAYRLERAQEVRVLCEPFIREHLQSRNISLCSFHDLSSNAQLSKPQSCPGGGGLTGVRR
jgi:predicted glycoside hydrolase/deacetylase ChbG (UPF0249 family)